MNAGILFITLCFGGDDASARVPGLLRELAEAKHAAARAEAARRLGVIGPPGEGLADDSVPLVAGLLRTLETDKDAGVRTAALESLLRSARGTPRS